MHEGVLATRAAYRNGILWFPILFLISTIGLLATLADNPRFTTGFCVVFGLFIALFVGSMIRAIQFPGSFQRTWFYFTDWIWHGSFLRQPPWSFRARAAICSTDKAPHFS